jgi:Tol biopolymer transport system component
VVYNLTTGEFVSFGSLEPATHALYPVFHPDGRRVLFTWEADRVDGVQPKYLGMLDLDSGAVEVLLETNYPIGGAFFLPDGEHIVFDMDGLYLFDMRLNETFRLTPPDDSGFPRASGSGIEVVLMTWATPPTGPRTYGVSLYLLDTGERVSVLAPTSLVQPRPDIDASGQRIVYVRGILGIR